MDSPHPGAGRRAAAAPAGRRRHGVSDREKLPQLKNFSPIWRFTEALPTGVFIGRDGKVRQVKLGFKPEKTPALLEKKFKELLAEGS